QVFTPIQDGAAKVLSPVRDLAGWVSSTLHAKSQNKELRALNAKLNFELAAAGTAVQENRQLTGMLHLTARLNLGGDGPVYANVTTYNPQVWYETLKVDKGLGSGIAVGDPVLSAQGLVGEVSSVGSNYAIVSELSSPRYGVEARIIDSSGRDGIGTLGPEVGSPTTLQVNYLAPTATIQSGDEVVTAGYSDPGNPTIHSLYPPGIPIGTVSNFDYNTLVDNGTVNVSPNVDLRNVSQVEILTKVRG
ncbi:MAG TPA: rod shape-determining protein MreC, partial [Solirubrobacteraceae bacterium]|nr:rod shape-determining protein MreC [Solirubrobacteraceae bacterium]